MKTNKKKKKGNIFYLNVYKVCDLRSKKYIKSKLFLK